MKIFSVFMFIMSLNKFCFAQCYLNSQQDEGMLLSTTGSKSLDKLLVDESEGMQILFNVPVKLYAYEGRNAIAYKNTAFIKIGKSLMLDQMVKTNNTHSIIAIMAHEFGHMVQYKYNMDVFGSWGGKWAELHADYMSGWYMGIKQSFSGDKLTFEEFCKVVDRFFEIGDFNYFDPNHHGTQQERSIAFRGGFYSATTNQYDLNSTYLEGQKYVIKMNELIQAENQAKYNQTSSQTSVNNANTSKKVGYLCLFGLTKKSLKADLYLGNKYLGRLKETQDSKMPKYGANGTISVPLLIGNYTLIIHSTSGILGGKVSMNYKYITITENTILNFEVVDN